MRESRMIWMLIGLFCILLLCYTLVAYAQTPAEDDAYFLGFLNRLLQSDQSEIYPAVIAAFMALNEALDLGFTFDNDETLEFYWAAAAGEVDHYSVSLFIDGVEHSESWTTATLPTAEAPYAVPYSAAVGHIYRIKVAAVDRNGNVGPSSELSGPVLRIRPTTVSWRPQAVR